MSCQLEFEAILNELKQGDNEATNAPYWLIIDPRQMMKPDCHAVAGMITGPFFSRKSAQNFLTKTRYNFSHRAVVYCHSGNYSNLYYQLCKKAGI